MTTASVVLHLGAHRTASSRVQRILASQRHLGNLDAVAFHGPHDIRHKFRRWFRALDNAPALKLAASPTLLRAMIPALAADLKRADRPVVISDETLLTRAEWCVLGGRGLYPDAGVRMQALRRLLGSHDVRPVLVTRSYGPWFASAYAMLLRRRDLPDAEALAAQWARLPRGWVETVEDIVAAFGACDVIPFEAQRDDPLLPFRALIGDLTGRLDFQDRVVNVSMTAAAAAEIRRLRAEGHWPKPQEVYAIEAAHADGPKLPYPFDPETDAVLKDRYAKDLAALPEIGARLLA